MFSINRFSEFELIQQTQGLEFQILMEGFISSAIDSEVMRIEIQLTEEQVEDAAFGIIFTLAQVSFKEAPVIEIKEKQYRHEDKWTMQDLIQHLSFADGKLQFRAGKVRGKEMNTDISIHPKGLMVIETRYRGSSARRWINFLRKHQARPPLGNVYFLN